MKRAPVRTLFFVSAARALSSKRREPFLPPDGQRYRGICRTGGRQQQPSFRLKQRRIKAAKQFIRRLPVKQQTFNLRIAG